MLNFSRAKRTLSAISLGLLAALQLAPAALAQTPKSSVTLAMAAEPPSLDPMQATTDLVGTIMQHVFETLYTFDAKWNVVPMLASTMPQMSADGKTVTITLRKDVKFHNGRTMVAEDVVISLKRWMKEAPRGKSVAKEISDLRALNDSTVEITLLKPYAPLLAQLALPTGMAAILPKEASGIPLRDFVGTGPYRFKERRTDQYVVLNRFDTYSARTDAPNGYGGKREALIEELRFVPVPTSAARIDGAVAGQYQFADSLPIDALARLEKADSKSKAVITPAFGFPYLVFNTREGVNANKTFRQAIQTALGHGELLAAGFSDTRFFAVEGNHFPQGSPYYSTAGTDLYNQRNPEKAKALAADAGYKGETVRILTSRQYDFHFNMATKMVQQLGRAGIKAELTVVDWATLVQRRNDSAAWDIYVTHSGLLPEPMLSPPQLGDGAPGWWFTPAKQAAILEFNHASLAKRGPLWGKVQALVYDEVPYIVVGKFNGLTARSEKLDNFRTAQWPYFWNVSLKN
jgi:peptide/nickel transport system substrate-binding protein